MIHATKILSHFLAGLKYSDLAPEVVNTTKQYILDYYAACYAGIKVNDTFNRAVEEVLFEMGGKEEASVLYSDRKLPVMEAAFLNAVYAHGADMDDGNRKAMGHAAAHVMSAVFALAETLEVSGKDIIVAINAGYEVYNRVAAAVQPGLVRRGFHSTGTAGALACGAAAAKLMGLSEDEIYNALSLAAIQSSGLMVITESGQSCKPINPANAARVGILAAKLAQKGVESSRFPLESKKGWFHAMSDEVDESAITGGLGEVFTITESYLKPYPACRHAHCGIDGVLKIREEILARYGCVDSAAIERIDIDIYSNAISVAGQIEIPQTTEDTKFSIHYATATALLKGQFGLDELDLSNLTEASRDLIGKIHLLRDDAMEDRKAGIRGARVTVSLYDGTVYSETVLIPKGDATNPFSEEDLQAKLQSCTEGLLTAEQRVMLAEFVGQFEELQRFRSINAFVD